MYLSYDLNACKRYAKVARRFAHSVLKSNFGYAHSPVFSNTIYKQPSIKKYTINKKPITLQQFKGFLNTPPLWEGEQFGVPQFQFPEVVIDSFVPSPIPENLRLGHQMEYVCKQFLDQSDAYDVLVHNLPIRNGKQTIGEIDFILKETATRQLIHVELTYKFYLIDNDIENPIHQLVGPNRSDAFYKKLQKIKNNQFSLVHTGIGRSILLEKEIETTNIKQQVCFKAQLFKPYKADSLPLDPFNANCIVGYWLRLKDFKETKFSSFQFYIPTKSEWVVEPNTSIAWSSHTEIILEIHERLEHKSSPMVWVQKNKTTYVKIFVVWW